MEIVLASKSPRRKELLGRIISDFTVLDAAADETVPADLEPAERVALISIKKADAAEKLAKSESIIISADTAVFADNEQFGKPVSKADATRMLKVFSGRCHSVITAFTVSGMGKRITRSVETLVYFRNLSDDEIDRYTDTDEPYDKAGGYGIQGIASKFVEKIDGDYSNVVGLPVCELTLALREFGLKV